MPLPTSHAVFLSALTVLVVAELQPNERTWSSPAAAHGLSFFSSPGREHGRHLLGL